MKTIFLLITFSLFIVSLSAQTSNSTQKKDLQQLTRPDDIPSKIINRKSAGNILSYKDYTPPALKIPGKNTTPKMPVIQGEPEFNTGMPVMVPDTSVHYYLKILDGKSEHRKK